MQVAAIENQWIDARHKFNERGIVVNVVEGKASGTGHLTVALRVRRGDSA
jgi:hypothetical protein